MEASPYHEAASRQNGVAMKSKLRLGLLLLVIALLGVGWTYGWQRGAQEIERRADAVATRIADRGGAFECAGRRIGGFPFRIGIFCDSMLYASPNGATFAAGAVRSAAQFYAPGHVVLELDPAGRLTLPSGEGYVIGWQSARASLRAGMTRLDSFDLEIREPRLAEAGATADLGKASHVELHLRRNPDNENAVDIAFSGTTLHETEAVTPDFDIAGDLRLDEATNLLQRPDAFLPGVRANGLKGEARNLEIRPLAGGLLSISGPFSIDENGLLDADLNISASNLLALADFLATLAPRNGDEIRSAVGLLASVAPSSKSGSSDADKRSIRLNIRRGKISLGVFALGELPPLF